MSWRSFLQLRRSSAGREIRSTKRPQQIVPARILGCPASWTRPWRELSDRSPWRGQIFSREPIASRIPAKRDLRLSWSGPFCMRTRGSVRRSRPRDAAPYRRLPTSKALVLVEQPVSRSFPVRQGLASKGVSPAITCPLESRRRPLMPTFHFYRGKPPSAPMGALLNLGLDVLTGEKDFSKNFTPVSTLEGDLLTLAAAVFAADRGCERGEREDFARSFELYVPIVNIGRLQPLLQSDYYLEVGIATGIS
jgi:hypothetical protein